MPVEGHSRFVAAIAGAFASFAVGGLFAGLTGTFLVALIHDSSPALIGLTIFLSYGAGVLVQATTTSWSAHRLLPAGIPPIIPGLLVLVASAWATPPSLGLFLVSSALAGAGIGAMIRGCLTAVISTAAPEDRASAVATLFTAGYIGVSIPVIGVAVVLQYLDPRDTLMIYATAIALAILAAARVLVRPPAVLEVRGSPDTCPMTGLCRCFGAELGVIQLEPKL